MTSLHTESEKSCKALFKKNGKHIQHLRNIGPLMKNFGMNN